jgi:hypothetical protein
MHCNVSLLSFPLFPKKDGKKKVAYILFRISCKVEELRINMCKLEKYPSWWQEHENYLLLLCKRNVEL